MVVAGQAALAYETARLMESFVAKEKQDNEMAIARDVQLALLPTELPKAEGYEFYASYDSAQAVGGDYYDAFVLGDDKICLAFGDVAGKGVPGAPDHVADVERCAKHRAPRSRGRPGDRRDQRAHVR